jgi:transcriptional regulator with XRE-family HTH domain
VRVPRGRGGDTRESDVDAQLRVFGANMRAAREQAGLTQQELSLVAHLDRAAISFIERAKRSPDLGTLLKIAQALRTTPADLLRDVGVERPTPRGPRNGEEPSDPARRLGANLGWARRRANVSQEALALEASVDRAAISVYEHGRREPNLRTILKLADALDIPAATLLRGVK